MVIPSPASTCTNRTPRSTSRRAQRSFAPRSPRSRVPDLLGFPPKYQRPPVPPPACGRPARRTRCAPPTVRPEGTARDAHRPTAGPDPVATAAAPRSEFVAKVEQNLVRGTPRREIRLRSLIQARQERRLTPFRTAAQVMNPGRLALSVPRPYRVHDPRLGRVRVREPVWMNFGGGTMGRDIGVQGPHTEFVRHRPQPRENFADLKSAPATLGKLERGNPTPDCPGSDWSRYFSRAGFGSKVST